MKERPILFSAPMVRAILDGTKTQTRRVVKSPAKNAQATGRRVIEHREPGDAWYGDHVWSMRGRMGVWGDYTHERFMQFCPYGAPGDRLWVRETWQIVTGRQQGDLGACVRYRDMELNAVTMPTDKPMALGLTWDRWRPSIHMPRWASRITLEVTSVRVERVQDISEGDARAEGVSADDISRVGVPCYSARQNFERLWVSINGAESWARNDWVWVVGFKRVTP